MIVEIFAQNIWLTHAKHHFEQSCIGELLPLKSNMPDCRYLELKKRYVPTHTHSEILYTTTHSTNKKSAHMTLVKI